jgi:hypothetical protein
MQNKKIDTAGAAFTSAPIVAGNSTAPIAVEFIRLPQTGSVDPITGLSRSTLNELILASPLNGHKPPVRSISLRKTGRARGIRLIDLRSLLDFLHRQSEGGLTT